MRFGIQDKLNPKDVGPFRILDKIGEVAYRFALPSALARVHNVFHIFMMRRYVVDPNHAVRFKLLQLNDNISYKEQPIKIVDRKD